MTKDTPIVETEWKEETPTVETEWTDVEVVKKKDNADSKLEIGSKVSTSSVGQSKSTSESSTVNKPTYDVSKLTNIPGLNTQKTQQLDLTRPAQKKTISQKEPLLKPTQKELVTGDYIIKDDRPKNIEKIQSALGKGTPVVEQKQTIKVEENPYKVDITDKSSENTSTKNQVAKRSILEDATALNTLSSDELINVDETTANDFLVSSGVKNKDREQYISEQAQSNPKYGYDYEYNKIGSLYKAVKQRADDYDVVLKEKFGDNYFELAKQGDVNVVNDEDFNKFAQLREKQNQLSTKANGLINEDKYKEVKDYNIQKEKKQAEADAIAKKDTWYNPKDELKYIDSKVAQTLGKVVKMVAEIPALATSIDKGYDWTDKLADWGDRYANAVIDDVPVSSDFKGSFSNDVANVDGYKVIVDENKNVIDVRDKNNFKVPASVSQPLIEKYSANPANYKIKNEKSYRSLVDNGLNTVLDMGVMILGTKGAGMLGAAEKLQKLTSIGIAYQQTKRDVFNDAIKKGLDPRKADELSNIIAIAAGTSNLINPMEYNIASGKGLFSFIKKEGLDASKIALINEGKLGIKDYAKQFVKSGLKNTVGENIEELGIENTTQAIANNAFNKSISAEDRTDGGLDDKLHIFDKQGLETFLITSGAAMLMTPIEMKSQTTFNQQEALKMAMEKPDDFAKIRQMQVANGTITPQQFESEKKILEEVSQTYNASKDDIKEELQPQLIALLVKKYNLTNKINEIKDEALASPYKVILEKVNAGIQDIAGGKSASPELVETVEENINPATGMVVEQTDTKVPVVNTTIGTATAKDGSDIITQTKVAISNKNAKGEPLTGEEQDFYNNYKEEIDGLASKVESSNEVKITDEKYKDIPSQKIEYKDGTAFVHKDKEGNKEHLFISRMDVSNKGKGTGSEMLKKVEEHALKIELDQVVTIPETDASRKFFEKNGYTYSDGILTKDLKQKTKKDETKITPIKPVEQGQQNNDGTGLSETAKEEVEGVSGSALKDVESTAKALDEAEKNSPITIEQTEFGGKVSGGIIDVKIKAIKGDKKENVKTPSTLNFLPRVLELVHLARNKKDKAKIISGKFDSNNVSIDSPIPGIYFSSEDWSTMDRFGRSKEDSIYTTIDNDGLLYFDSAKGLRSFLKENNLPSEGQTLNASQVATLKNMGVKGILLREDFASQSRNELIVIDESIIKSVSEKPISGVTKLPPSFSNTKDISEAYHKAKADGSNPELVKAVESLLSKEQTPTALRDVESTAKALEGIDTKGKVPLSLEYAETDKKAIAEAYHADRAAGKETELTKAVEELLGKPTEKPKTETTPTVSSEVVSGSALKDVESTVKAIEKNPSVINKIIGDEYYHGTSLPKSEPDFTTANKDKGVGVRSNAFMGTSREQKSPFFFITSERDVANDFAQAKKEYHDDKVKPNEKHTSRIIPFKFNEKNSKILDLTKDDYEFVLQEIGESPIDFFGMGMYEQDQMWEMLDEPKFAEKLKSLGYDAVKFIEPKRGIGIAVLNTDKIVNSTPKGIAEAYHKAKADGSNPELVKAVEDLLGKAPTQYTEAATPKDDSAIQSGGEQKLPDQKEVQVTAEEKINPLESKFKKKIPTEKVEETVDEIVTPIRQLGTGANVYFETPKYRVNETKDGKVLLNINGEEDGGMAIANIEFDNVNEAVKVAERLQQDFPNGIPDDIRAEKYVEATREDLNKENINATPEVSKPVSEVADNTEQQGVKEAVSKSVDATGQGNAEVAVADVKTPISKTETTEKQNKVVASDNTKNKKKDYEMSSSEYEKERQISVPVFKRAKIIAIRILDWSGTGGLYEKYINSKGIKPNINGVYENTDISNIEDYMKFLLKEKADFFTREDYETYLKYKDFMDRGIDPDWNNHETRVSSALYENKEVPKSVLSEYPNLENKESGIAEITPNKNVSASKASAIKDLLADKYSDLKEMEAGVLANLDGTESIDDLMEYVDWNRTTQKGGVYKGKGLKGSNIVKLIEKGYVEELSFMDENITLTDKGKKFQEALKARQETRKGIKEGTDLFPKDAGLSGKELIGDALDRIVDKIGGKKNLTEQEKTTLTKDITDLAKGLLQEGKATIDNIIDKIIDAIKKRLPDLDEKDVKDLADTVNDKVIFSEGVKWYKDNGYTYEQTKKRLDEINADYTEQELKDAWDGEKKEKLDDSKQRVADRFVKGNNSFEDAKNMVIENGYDKGDYDSKQIIKDIDNLIKKTGIENIEQLLDLPLSEPHRVVLQSKLIEHFGNQSTDESLSAEQREEAFEKSARYLLDLSRERTDSGRGNAILNQIYMDTDIYFTLPMMMKKMDALGTILSDTEMAEIKEMAKEIEQLREENKKLQELAKKEEEQNIIDDITTHLLVDELIIDSKTKEDEEIKKAKNVLAKGFQDIARMLGGIKMVTQEEKVKFTETILDMTKATMTISKIGVKRALKAVIKSIRSANPNIDENLIKDAEQHVLNNIKETDTGIKKKDGTGISKDELLALVEGGADTMDKLIVAIRDKYHDGDKNVTDKQIRDEITNYGKSTRESRTDIEKKLTEIKSVMLLQSKLEDAENNIAPKKTGLIRDKATMPVREKRRELAEAMKKLTVTLTEDDIAGLNERKLTQLANRIEEVQNVLKGIQKPNKQGVFEYSDEVKKKQKELDDLMNDQKVLLHYAKEKLNNLLAKYQDRLDKKQYAKNPTINKLTLTDKEYVDLKAKLEAKKEELKKKRNDFRNNDADYLLNTKQKQIDRQIAELDNLLSGINQRKTSEQLKAERDRKAGIINTSTNTTALQKLKDNQAKLEAKKEEWEKKVIQKEIEEEKKKRTWLDKLGVFYEEVKATSRLATLGLIDIGWVGVQGGYFLRTKPITTLKSLKNAWDSGGLSEKEFDAWRKELKNNPFYETMLKAGLDIPNQSLRQDLWQQEFRPSTVSNFLDKVPILNIPNKNGRLSLKFLTNLRIKAFNDLYNGLTATQKTDPEILEKLADFVNSRSGAGRVIGEDKNRGLNKHWNFMTSVRNTSSMLQQTYIGMLYGLYKNYDSKSGFSINPKTAMAKQPIVYRQITHDLQNQIVLWGTVYLAYLLANINDKDKEDDWNVELSPFSTDFGKLKNKSGNRSYFDIGGTTALNVASLRLLFTVTNGLGLSDVQNYKNYKGEYSQLNAQGWGGKKGIDIAASAFLNRTLSFYSPIKTPLIAEKNKDGNYNIFGQNYTPSEYKWKIIKDMVFPMNIPAVWNDYKDKDVNAGINVLDFILSGTGISYNNQIYDSKQPSQNTQKAPSVNSLGAPLQKPKKKESIFKNMFNKNP